jgi:hypothetical protein
MTSLPKKTAHGSRDATGAPGATLDLSQGTSVVPARGRYREGFAGLFG